MFGGLRKGRGVGDGKVFTKKFGDFLFSVWVVCHHLREYLICYAAVGEVSCFLVEVMLYLSKVMFCKS